ncbi:MAG: DUF4145 domain-containing protein [Alphaproteobacteria bacterium]|jgi:hypothetical protein|nr:DUF4145 domain-containing protein [Alphaproteobacteria bacterium]
MPEIVADCPRCGAKEHTFSALSGLPIGQRYGWQKLFELYCKCKNCLRGTIFIVKQKSTDDFCKSQCSNIDNALKSVFSLNNILEIEGFICIKDMKSRQPPDYVPDHIQDIFKEGTCSLSMQCPNAAGSMFRLCLDLTTKGLLPEKTEQIGPNQEQRKRLDKRLGYLFSQNIIDRRLEATAHNIRLDGNDGAHDGTLSTEDAEDLCDFTYQVLETVYTHPCRIEEMEKRREARRNKEA